MRHPSAGSRHTASKNGGFDVASYHKHLSGFTFSGAFGWVVGFSIQARLRRAAHPLLMGSFWRVTI
jgi:hypothetical protein